MESDWIATEMHDTRFYEQTNYLLLVAGKWLSMANIGLFVVLIGLVIFMPERGNYYITAQNGQMKPLTALTHAEIKARVAANQQQAQPVKH